MAISVGSVEVDVVPNTRGIYARLRSQLVPEAARAGEDAGEAAGRRFGPAMADAAGGAASVIGQRVGRQIGQRIAAEVSDSLRDGVNLGGRQSRGPATRQGSATGGAFARAARARIEAALRTLPDIDIDANTTPAQAEILRLRAQLVRLSDQEIGVDIDSGAALAQIQAIQARLRALAASDADVQVRVDAGAALAELAAVQAMVSALDRRDIDINVSTRQARMAVLILAAAIGSLVAIPAVPVLAAGIGSIAAAATAAAAGVGALAAAAVPAFMDIAKALQAQKAAQDAASTATASGGQTAAQAAQRSMQLESAQQALAAAHRNAAQQIRQAEQGVADAARNAAENSRRAADQVKDAKRSLAAAAEAAADRQRAAAERVQDAEESLADAQRDARQAQRDLTSARREAAEELVDLGNRLASAQLSERSAVLEVQEAERQLRAVRAAGSKATQLEQQRAQLDYDQAVQRLREQRLDTKRLAAEKKAADKAGVAGSEQVRTAQQRLADAQESVRDRSRDLANAQREAARQQVQGQRDIAEAQGRVAEAQRNVVRVQEEGARSVARAQQQLVAAQQSAADSIASAQRQIRSAQLSTAGGANAAATAQAKYREALGRLTPAARETFNAFVRLRGAFSDWSRSLQPAVMPIFTRALNGLRKSLPGLTPFVREAARAIGELQDRASRGFQSKGWKTFKKDLLGGVRPAIVGLGRSLGNIGRGLGGIIRAFLPHMDEIAARMVRITDRFGDWGQNLKGSPAFEGFLAYSSRMAPVLSKGLGDIGRAFLEVSRALSPLSGPAIQILGALARGVASIATTLPWLVQGIYLVIIATKLWTLAMAVLSVVMRANPIVLIITGIVALVAAVVYAYKRFGWFRAAVQAVWGGIKAAAVAVYDWFRGPFVRFFTETIPAVFWTVIDWVKKHWPLIVALLTGPIGVAVYAIIRNWGRIRAGLAAVWRWIVRRVLAPIGRFFTKTIPGWARYLWQRTVRAWRGMQHGVRDVWLWIVRRVLLPIGRFFTKTIPSAATFLFRKVAGRWREIRAALIAVKDAIWKRAVEPLKRFFTKTVPDAASTLKRKVVDAFQAARDGIGKAWAKIKELTRKPIKWVIDIVYNKGIRGLWNAAAKVLPIKNLPEVKVKGFARGGVLPGTSSFRQGDDQLVPMRRGEGVYVSEAMRDPYERARLHAVNAAAMRGRSLTDFQGGGYALGGIIGDIGGFLGKGLGKAKDWVLGGITKAAELAAKPVRALIDKIPGGTSGFGRLATAVPKGLLDAAISAIRSSESSQLGGAHVARALKWARTQHGKRYQWGGNGNPSWDCSGFVSAIESVIRGQKPHRRWSTHAFAGGAAPPGWKRGLKAPYQVGITHSGVGHTAGTIMGVNVESRGGDGVVVGPRARGAHHPMFSSVYGFAPSIGGGTVKGVAGAKSAAQEMLGRFGWGRKQWPPLDRLWMRESGWRWNARNPSSGAYGIPQSLPASKMRSAGADWRTNPITQIRWGLGYIRGRYGSPSGAWAHSQRTGWYDDGGWLPPGGIGFNGLSEPEAVLTPQQFKAMEGAAKAGVATAAGGNTYHWEVNARTADITPAQLQHLQRTEAVRLRYGRRR